MVGRGHDTRARLIKATQIALFDQLPTQLRLAQIARSAGVATSAVYTYFDSREDLLAAAFLANLRRYVREQAARIQRVRTSLATKTTSDSEILEFTRAELQRDNFADRRQVIESCLHMHAMPQMRRDGAPLVERALDDVIALVEREQHTGNVRTDMSAESLGLLIWACIDGLALWSEMYDDNSYADFVNALIQLVAPIDADED